MILCPKCGKVRWKIKKARPVTTIVYQFSNWRYVVYCYPQQRWIMEDKGDAVKLERNNVTLEIWKEDFEKHCVEVKG